MEIDESRITLSWDDVRANLAMFDHEGERVYGVPRGGMIAASLLRKAEVVTDPIDATWILDDLIDSGRTRQRYLCYSDALFGAVLDKSALPEEHRHKWVVFPWESQHPFNSDDIVIRFLQRIGENPNRPGLIDTPNRVIRSWDELFKGYRTNPDEVIRLFDEELDDDGGNTDEVVLLRDIEFFSTCEHHTLPFFGRAHVAYLPGTKLLGISKLARLVEVYSRRLQIQERIGKQVTQFLMSKVKARGAACVIEASHLCMRMRGVNKQNSVMVTSSLRGVFRDDAACRAEIMHLIFNGRQNQ